jgi:hypothetical protein
MIMVPGMYEKGIRSRDAILQYLKAHPDVEVFVRLILWNGRYYKDVWSVFGNTYEAFARRLVHDSYVCYVRKDYDDDRYKLYAHAAEGARLVKPMPVSNHSSTFAGALFEATDWYC